MSVTSTIGPKDKYCCVFESRGLEYKNREFEIVKYGPSESTIRDVKTKERKTFYNVHLYATFEQRRRSAEHRRAVADAIGRNHRHK